MDDRCLNALIGASTRVCGYQLNALTPWHHVLLSAIDSPVFDPDRPKETKDLLIFLKIAQTRWPQVPSLKPSLKDVWWTWRMKKPKIIRREIGRMREWLDAQLAMPQFWENDNSSGNTLSSPPIFALVVGLVSKGGISLDQAWNMRMAESRWFDATLAELNGAKIKFSYEGENEEIAKQLKEMSEEQKVEMARQHMPADRFKKWMAAREANKKKEDK